MPLALADTSKTKKFEDGDAWLELRVELTKADSDEISDATSNYRVSAAAFTGQADADRSVEFLNRLAHYNRTVFGKLAVAWSLNGPPTPEAYDKLNEDSGRWVDQCIGEVLAERRRRAEGNASSETPASSSPGSSDEADPSTPES